MIWHGSGFVASWPEAERIQSCLKRKSRISPLLTIFVPPLRKIVTAFEFLHFSMTSILSLVVPNVFSRTSPALPSLSAVSSWNRGTMRPPVAMAMSSISGPPTHLKEGKNYSTCVAPG